MRSDRACLLDILDAIAGIEKYLTTRESFDSDELTQAWMVSRLQIIGEASRHLSREFRDRHSEVPWRLIVGMRHHLVHGYFDVDPDVVWAAITEVSLSSKRISRLLWPPTASSGPKNSPPRCSVLYQRGRLHIAAA